jgi:hypothetical protein
MVPEEFAKRVDSKKGFDGYQLRDRGDFMRQLRSDKDRMKNDELEELLGVANIAGIKVKDPSERLNKFEPDVLIDDDNDLDLTISWDDDNDDDETTTTSPTSKQTNKKIARTTQEPITRMDEDTGALGEW